MINITIRVMVTGRNVQGNEVEKKHTEGFRVLGNSLFIKLEAGYEGIFFYNFPIYSIYLFYIVYTLNILLKKESRTQISVVMWLLIESELESSLQILSPVFFSFPQKLICQGEISSKLVGNIFWGLTRNTVQRIPSGELHPHYHGALLLLDLMCTFWLRRGVPKSQ